MIRSPFRRRARRRPVQATRANHMLWGAGTLGVAFIACYLIFGFAIPGTSARELRLVTQYGGAVRPGTAAQVRIAGVNVGNITSLKPLEDRPGFAVITAKLNDDTPTIRRDATVKIRPRLFLEGNFFLDVNPGTPGAPPLGDQPLPPSATTSYVAFDEVLGTFDAATRKNFTGATTALGDTVGQGDGATAFQNLVKALPPALRTTAVVTKAARGLRDGDLIRTIREAGGLFGTLDSDESALRSVLADGRRTFTAFADESQNLRGTIRGLDGTVETAGRSLATISRAVPETRALVNDARPLIRRLPRTLDVANPALSSSVSIVRSDGIQRLLADLRPTLATLNRTTVPLARALDDAVPVARCVDRVILPTLRSKILDGGFTTGQPVYRELLSTIVGLNNSVSNFDGNGYWIRYSVGLGNQALSIGAGSRQTATLAERPTLGSVPASPRKRPPLRPDVQCDTQGVPSLAARVRPNTAKQRQVDVTPSALTKATSAVLGGLIQNDGALPAATRSRLDPLLGAPEKKAKR
ncbi:MlaD family protein [Patulibacter brassicae]|uniref:MlaD family protein n=1 Tax=Patulibacter brassicae TaxID=1705717 RepID=A0ABU4VP77_9ACTN|nr:MlaD family protein [Patulibacter brassicae]MDX8153658.1 MlaD family protein [Patulibacter brassicae]